MYKGMNTPKVVIVLLMYETDRTTKTIPLFMYFLAGSIPWSPSESSWISTYLLRSVLRLGMSSLVLSR